jgi:hypothetical protein
LAGPKAAVGLIVLDGVPALVDEPVPLIVLIDEHVGTEVAVECPGILQRSVHDIARRRHRRGLQREFKDHRDRHRRVLVSVVKSPAGALMLSPGPLCFTGAIKLSM